MTTDTGRWRGRLAVGDYWASWRGHAGDAKLHRHFAAQAIDAPQGARLHLVTGEIVEGRRILVDPLVAHRLDPVSDVVLHFLEPAAIGDHALDAELAGFRGDPAVRVVADTGAPFWPSWISDGQAPTRPRTAALAPVLAQIDAELSEGVVRLAAVVRQSPLSASRFRHLFAQEIGLPFRRYVLWRRLRLAVIEIQAGADATAAAHAAGFADLAHFSRTLKAMFGVSASQALSLPGRSGRVR